MGKSRSGNVGVSRKALVGALLAVAASALLVACLASSAPATNQLSAPITLSARNATLAGRDIIVSGRIVANEDLSGAVVRVHKREVGESADTFVAEAVVTYDQMNGNTFQATVPAARRSCQITATWAGNGDYLASSFWMFAGVKPKLKLVVKKTTRKHTEVRITVSPEQPFYQLPLQKPPFIADVQCRVHGVWTRFPASLGGAGTDGRSWCTYSYYDVKPGKYLIRAQFTGTNYNVAGVSSSQRIVVP
ncbi:MAG: hypothetical protein R2826_02530 [Thermoleophilia bacterium]